MKVWDSQNCFEDKVMSLCEFGRLRSSNALTLLATSRMLGTTSHDQQF